MPRLPVDKAKKLVQRRHHEWVEHHRRWTWLGDSLEGGLRYKDADYAPHGQAAVRNLLRHPREVPVPPQAQQVAGGGDVLLNAQTANLPAAAQSNYDLRLARTPIPMFVAEALEKYLSRIYKREIKRESAEPLANEWWDDVDGCGTTMDEWMTDTVAPLLVTLGCLDLHFDHPPAPEGEQVETAADVQRLGLGAVIASVILPENVLWWERNPDGTYRELLLQEYHDGPEGPICLFRHWTDVDSVLYDHDGNCCTPDGSKDGRPYPHPFGRVPIRRVFDRKLWRCGNVGLSRMGGTAEKQRDYYNRDSELILTDVMQSSPPLSGPVDAMNQNAEITIGPGYVLPKMPDGKGGYVGWEYVTLDKSGDESIRKNQAIRRDEIDRETAQTKPAGAVGSSKGAVAQSGVSKQLDDQDGVNILGKLVKVLQKAERLALEFALLVATDGEDEKAFKVAKDATITYPTGFNLYSAQEQLDLIAQFQALKMGVGDTPTADTEMLQRAMRIVLAGLDDSDFAAMDEELENFVAGKGDEIDRMAEGRAAALEANTSATPEPEAPGGAELPGPGPSTATLNPYTY